MSGPRSPTTRCGRSGGSGSGTGGSGSDGTVQGSSNGKGTVIVSIARSDDKKQGIKNSKVVLIGPSPGQQRRSEKTDSQGNATFKNLDPGSYTFKHELPDTFLVSMAHSSEVSVAENGHALGVAKAFATGTLKIRVVDTLTKALIEDAIATTTAGPQPITWAPKSPGEQTFAGVAPGRYEVTASADPLKYEALLNGRTPASFASVVAGGTGTATVELMPRSWIKLIVRDTLRNKVLDKATVLLQPSGAAVQTSPPSEAINPLEFGFPKSSTTAGVIHITTDGDELYEVLGVDAT